MQRLMTIAGYDKGPVSRARASARRGVEAGPDSDERLNRKNLSALMILPISVLAAGVVEKKKSQRSSSKFGDGEVDRGSMEVMLLGCWCKLTKWGLGLW